MSNGSPDMRTLLGDALAKIKSLQAQLAESETSRHEPIAIIGVACRFPGNSSTPDAFWQFLRRGGNGVTEVPAERWVNDDYFDPDPTVPGKTHVRHGAFVHGVDHFEPQFFGVSPRETVCLDPQQRLLLELSWEALERAAIVPSRLHDSATGVFIGIAGSDYGQLLAESDMQDGLYSTTGVDDSVAAGRISYVLGLTGPSMAIDTACSSALVAVHLACQSLRNRECKLALAGGVGLMLRPEMTIAFSKAGMLAPDGRCKTFAAAADGYVRGEGGAVIALKRLSDALADRDPICAVIRGSAVNHDGASGGLTAPRGPAQQEVIRQALAAARVRPEQLTYIEAHGTGTALGDPIELGALAAAFKGRSTAPLCVGSVKTNIGHLEAAAGMAGLVKLVLMLQHREIPPHLHFDVPTPHIDWAKVPLRVPTAVEPWQAAERIGGVSSFGYSGTNAHVVLSEAPAPVAEKTDTAIPDQIPYQLFTLSANTAPALVAQVRQLQNWLASNPSVNLPNLCHTTNNGRTHFAHRLAIPTDSIEHLQAQLAQFDNNENPPGIARGQASGAQKTRRVAFLFSGQGSQYAGMSRQLYSMKSAFRTTLERCDELLQPLLHRSLLPILFDLDVGVLDQTEFTQVALFALEYALAELWNSWGVQADFVLGHSIGEYVAACLAGVFSLSDALKLVVARGRLMQALPQDGAMVVVTASEAQVKAAIALYPADLAIAAVNGPEQIVISGRQSAVAALVADLSRANIKTRQLVVSHAFHSPLMAPILTEFEQIARTVTYHSPRIKLISNLTGTLVTDEVTDPMYWVRHISQPVRFADGVSTLVRQGATIFLEVGPRPTLLGQAQEVLHPETTTIAPCYLSSLRKGRDDWQHILQSLGKLYVCGVDVNWSALSQGQAVRTIEMPTYPFQRQRYWIQGVNPSQQKMQKIEKIVTTPVITKNDSLAAIVDKIRELMARLLQLNVNDVDIHTPFLELGSDSVVVMEAIGVLQQTYHMKLSARQVFESLNTVSALAQYIGDHVEPTPAPTVSTPAPAVISSERPATSAHLGTDLPSLERIFQQQLQLATESTQRIISEQLAFLRETTFSQNGASSAAPQSAGRRRSSAVTPVERFDPVTKKPLSATHTRTSLPPLQQNHLDRLTAQITQQTKTSKAMVQQSRPMLADSRASVGFRPSLKEMLYPIVVERAKGARMWDVDGNEYLDFMMGFGVNLFGHWPDCVMDQVTPHLADGSAIGMRSPLASKVAQRFTAITGHERVVFSATGTEAVMGAIRMVRAATGRTRIVMFEGAYHGHSDGTAFAPVGAGAERAILPIAPGIPDNLADNVLILPYDDVAALQSIREHRDELAGVLVEAVQSRRPQVQPGKFLQELRALTTELDIPLLFDEMITGFRLHPQGAQGYFGVKADIAVYGKILGGGFPIGAVAGKAKYLDGVDGGMWAYGDDSYPTVERVFFGGTFFQHPFSMAAALAVLEQIQAEGPQLQTHLNERTARFIHQINTLLTSEDAPIRAVHCGSLFRFQFTGNLEIFFYHLLQRGILVGEWRNCFLSTAHTDADLERTLVAIKETIAEMRAGGFLPARASGGGSPASDEQEPRQIPTTPAQRQLWLLHDLDDRASLAYHERIVVQLDGPLHLDALRDALAKVVTQHEALRSTLRANGQIQVVQASVPLEMAMHTLSEHDVTAWLAKEGQTPLDLETGPLFRVAVLQVAAQRNLLVFTAHHIIVDGLSLDIILSELAALYSCRVTGNQAKLLPARSFGEYVRWQAEQAAGAAFAKQSRYWQARLSGALSTTQLPIDHAYPAQKSYRGARQTRVLESGLARSLQRLGQEQQCTVLMTCLAAYLAFLHRLSGSDDLIVGVPTTGRGMPGSESVVGYCTHLLPIRSQLSGQPTFVEYLQQTKGVLLDAYDNSDYPYASLLDELAITRAANRIPLITAVFNLDKPRPISPMAGLTVEFPPVPKEFNHFDLALNLTQSADRWSMDWNYNTDIIESATIERWVDHFTTFLTEIVANPRQNLFKISLLSAPMKAALLAMNDNTVAQIPERVCFHQRFAEQAKHTPDAIAVVWDGHGSGETSVTYKALDEQANQLAVELQRCGVGPDVLVGLCVERSVDMVAGLLAILKAGGAFMPLDPTYPRDRLAFMLNDSGVELLLTERWLVERLPNSLCQTLFLDEHKGQLGSSIAPLKNSVTDRHLAYVIYTSGSTGQPKAVLNEHRGLANVAAEQRRLFDIRNTDRVLQMASLSFDVFVWEVVMALGNGAALILSSPDSLLPGPELLSLLDRQRVTILTITPTALTQLQVTPLAYLRVLICGAETLPKELRDRWLDPNGRRRLFNGYGPTEVSICTTFLECRMGQGPVSIGRPIQNIAVHILDAHQQPMPIGVPGELHIGGIGLARGYLNRPELTEQKFISHPFSQELGAKLYKTGDLCRLLADGNVEFLSRIDAQVKIRGFRIELGEIESKLSAHPAVRACVVTARQDGSSDKRLVAYVVQQSGPALTSTTLRAHLAIDLPEYMLPAAFVFLDALPLGPTGKVDRKVLPAPELKRPELGIAWAEPVTESERTLARVFGDVLRIERVGLHDDFFALGGDSITALQVVARAADRGLHVRVKQLFQNPTIARLASCTVQQTELAAVPQSPAGPVELTPIQQWFFATNSPDLHHFNQSVMLEFVADLSPALVHQALHAVYQHHHAFRLSFWKSAVGWTQALGETHPAFQLVQVDVSSCATKFEQIAQVEAHATRLQGQFDLGRGPLFVAAWFARGPGERPWLFLAAHHVVVDGVSWRILVEDVTSACMQIAAGAVVKLPPVRVSFADWSRRLRQYADSADARAQVAYWRTTINTPTARIGMEAHRGPNTIASTRTHTSTLDASLTRKLMHDMPMVYGTNTQELLLAALSAVFGHRLSGPSLRIDMESHGRDPEVAAELDLSRTVGWFTALYPLTLDLTAGSDRERIQKTKEAVRRVPTSGVGYGALRYMSRDASLASELQPLEPAELCFNYLGQMENAAIPGDPFRFLGLDNGMTISGHFERQHVLEINALVLHGQLQIHWTYSQNMHDADSVKALAVALEEEIARLVTHCEQPDAGGYTPIDFPLCGLTQEALDDVLESLHISGRGEVEDIYPQTSVQEGMLFHTLLTPETPVYYTQLTLHLTGDVNAEFLLQAWQHAVDQHPALRTSFVMPIDSRPLQVVHRRVAVPFEVCDVRDVAPAQQIDRLNVLSEKRRRAGFMLDKAPLLQLDLVRGDDTYLVFGSHHALMDGWSLSLLLEEVLDTYDTLRRGQTPSIPARLSQREYVAWLSRQDIVAAQTYWRRTLGGFTAPTPLPYARMMDHGSYADKPNGICKRLLSPTCTLQLRALTRGHQLTLSSVFQSAWAVLLGRLTGIDDVVFGVTVSGRTLELDDMQQRIGLFINTLPVRANVSGKSEFLSWCQAFQAQQLEASVFQWTPLLQCQSCSDVPKGQPLFESAMVFQNYPVSPDALEKDRGFHIASIHAHEVTNFPLLIEVSPGETTNDAIELRFEYSPHRFDAPMVERLMESYVTLLEGLADRPHSRIWELPLIGERERAQVLVEWNQTQAEYPHNKCIHQLFEAQVARTPHAIAVVFADKQISYRDLEAKANQLAHHLISLGAGPNMLVGLCVERSIEMVVGLLAILKAGGAYVPIDPAYPTARIAFLVMDSQVQILLTSGKLAPVLPDVSHKLSVDAAWPMLDKYSTENPSRAVSAEHLAYCIYTSGSTGQPKGTLIEHRGLMNYLTWAANAYQSDQGVGTPVNTSIGFDATVTSIYLPLLAGKTVYLLPEARELESLSDLLQSGTELSLVKLTPAHLEILEQLVNRPVAARCFVAGGEALLRSHVAFWHSHAPSTRIINEYGPTETVVGCCTYQVSVSDHFHAVPIGRPIANTQLYILDSYRQPVPVLIAGELYIGGAGVARGYHRRAELTAERFVDNPFGAGKLFKTGDLCRYLADGTIEFLGRIDDQVKLHGFRIELGEIEATLGRHPSVHAAAVLVREDLPGTRRLVAYVVLRIESKENGLSTEDLRAFLHRELPSYMVPAAFVVVESLPLTPNGKVDKKALPAPEPTISHVAYSAPTSNAEQTLARIWADVLHTPQVSAHDNFFALGGDSILSIQVVSRARAAGLHISHRDIFQSPTITQLALIATPAQSSSAEQGPVTGHVALTPIQRWFFEQHRIDPHHFNQPACYQVSAGLRIETLTRAVQHLANHHDALRARYVQTAAGHWQQTFDPPAESAVIIHHHDLASVSGEQQLHYVAEAAGHLQASLNLERGPLMQLVWFDLGNNEPGYLVWAIHHLVVDSVSWRILIEDLNSVYTQLHASEQPPTLPAKTSSFAAWADFLAKVALSASVTTQLEQWLKMGTAPFVPLPVDQPLNAGETTVASEVQFESTLSREQTQALLREASAAYRTQIDDLLLAALALTFREWTGQSTLWIDYEGHGRQSEFAGYPGKTELDLSRTVGWFTCMYPVAFTVTSDDPASAITTVKEQRRQVPDNGIGYGLLRYLRQDPHCAALPQPEVLFTYLGQLDMPQPRSQGGLAKESTALVLAEIDTDLGPAHGPLQPRTHVIDIGAWVTDGQLHLSWTYSKNIHHAKTIERLANTFGKTLGHIVDHCLSPQAGGYTPSDFALAALSQDDLNDVLQELQA